jgi:O-antigen ligase
MMRRELENRLSFILAWGTLAITLLVTDRISIDPVNVSKMVLLSVVAFSVLPIVYIQKSELYSQGKVLVSISLGFILFALISVFTSANTIERGLYGAFSRNTGLLTYTSLVVVFLAATLLTSEQSFEKVIKALLLAGVVNTVYSLIAASGRDIITWSNPSKAILGTFGNPNFISAFMGIFFTLLIVQVLDRNVSTRMRLLFLGFLPFVALTIYFSRSLQGIMVAGFGSILAIYFYIRSKEGYLRASHFYLGGAVTAGFLSIAGILNKGPLASLLYSYTVDLRGEYWKAGINMGLGNPIFGVGIDSYGTNYRTYRELSATVAPGLAVTTDSAHNVYIDVFAGIGFPGLLTYLAINGLILFAALKHLKRTKAFDGHFLTLFLCWATYQLQSIVSINQIGLAVWGWLLGGSLIAYTRSYSNGILGDGKVKSKVLVAKKLKRSQENVLLDASTSMKILGGAVIGLLIALPPFVMDAKLRNFFSGNSGKIETAVAIGQSWPVDNLRLERIIISLASNKQNEQARNFAAFAITKFPNDYGAWFSLYELTNEGIPEKDAIKKKLHLIDPYNPAYFEK